MRCQSLVMAFSDKVSTMSYRPAVFSAFINVAFLSSLDSLLEFRHLKNGINNEYYINTVGKLVERCIYF